MALLFGFRPYVLTNSGFDGAAYKWFCLEAGHPTPNNALNTCGRTQVSWADCLKKMCSSGPGL